MRDANFFRSLTEAKLQAEAEQQERKRKKDLEELEKARVFEKFKISLLPIMVNAAAEKRRYAYITAPEKYLLEMLISAGLSADDIYAFNTSESDILWREILKHPENTEISDVLLEISKSDTNHIFFYFYDLFLEPVLRYEQCESFKEFHKKYTENWWLDGICLACLADDLPSFFSLITNAAEAGKYSIDFSIYSKSHEDRKRLKYNSKIIYSNLEAIIEALHSVGFISEKIDDSGIHVKW
jgi:hypothetical protein